MLSPRTTYLTVLGGVVLWCAALVAAPFLVTFPGVLGTAGRCLYAFFHPICHQLSDRSFHLFGGPLAVCSRCASIYFAFLAGTVLYPVVRDIYQPIIPHRAFLIATVLPMLCDIGAGILGIHEVTTLTRLLSGAAFGLASPFFVVPAAIEAMQNIPEHSTSLSDIHTQKGLPHA